jgi:hypothetical protein
LVPTLASSEIPFCNAISYRLHAPSFLVTPPGLTASTRVQISVPQFGTAEFSGCWGLDLNLVVLGMTGVGPPPNPWGLGIPLYGAQPFQREDQWQWTASSDCVTMCKTYRPQVSLIRGRR